MYSNSSPFQGKRWIHFMTMNCSWKIIHTNKWRRTTALWISRRSSCQKCSVNCKMTTFSSLEYAASPHTVWVCWLAEELYCCTPGNRQRPTRARWMDQHCLEDSGPLPFISGPNLRQSDVRLVFQHLASVSCASLWVVLSFSGCGAFTLTYSVGLHLQICCWMWIRNS